MEMIHLIGINIIFNYLSRKDASYKLVISVQLQQLYPSSMLKKIVTQYLFKRATSLSYRINDNSFKQQASELVGE